MTVVIVADDLREDVRCVPRRIKARAAMFARLHMPSGRGADIKKTGGKVICSVVRQKM